MRAKNGFHSVKSEMRRAPRLDSTIDAALRRKRGRSPGGLSSRSGAARIAIERFASICFSFYYLIPECARSPFKPGKSHSTLVLVLFLLVLGLCRPAGAEEKALPLVIKGMTVSCQTSGWEWATPEMARTLDELKSLGVNSIAIHPYAQIQNDGHVRFRDRRQFPPHHRSARLGARTRDVGHAHPAHRLLGDEVSLAGRNQFPNRTRNGTAFSATTRPGSCRWRGSPRPTAPRLSVSDSNSPTRRSSTPAGARSSPPSARFITAS